MVDADIQVRVRDQTPCSGPNGRPPARVASPVGTGDRVRDMRDVETETTGDGAAEHWDTYVSVRTDLLVIGDGIVAADGSATGTREARSDRGAGGLVSPFPLSRWLRRGMERVVQRHGATACYPPESRPKGATDPGRERDLPAGYHRDGACAESVNVDGACIVRELFGGRNGREGSLLRWPIRFRPDRAQVDYGAGEARGRYRRLDRARFARDSERPTVSAERPGVDAVVDLEGCWRLTFRELEPAHLGLLAEAVALLDDRATEHRHQLGEHRNEGAGIVDCEMLSPLYDRRMLRAAFEPDHNGMDATTPTDEQWTEELRPAAVAALEERLAAWP